MGFSPALLVGTEVTLHCKLLVLAVLVHWVRDDFVVRCRIVFHGNEVVSVWSVDGDRALVELLVLHVIERKCGNRGIWVLLAVSQVSDEDGDVLFELSQVHGYVVLIESHIVIVLHMTCN